MVGVALQVIGLMVLARPAPSGELCCEVEVMAANAVSYQVNFSSRMRVSEGSSSDSKGKVHQQGSSVGSNQCHCLFAFDPIPSTLLSELRQMVGTPNFEY